MKLYITATFKNGENKEEIEKLCRTARKSGFDDSCFVLYQGTYSTPQELMRRAKEEINKCDGLLLDLSEKHTGQSIEAGIAYALGKKIIVIAKKGTLLKDTVRGISDVIIEYDQIEDITPELTRLSRL